MSKFDRTSRERFARIAASVDKSFILLHSKHFDGVVVTQGAYEEIKRCMDPDDRMYHISTWVSPDDAAFMCEEVLTEEDVNGVNSR